MVIYPSLCARCEQKGEGKSEAEIRGREMKTKIALKMSAIVLMFAISVMVITIPPVVADRGVIAPSIDIPVPVFESEQKAVVAWNESMETLIISTDVNAPENSTALEILPLPLNYGKIKAGNLESFNQTLGLIEEELENVSSCVTGLFEDDAWLTAWRYNGSIENFNVSDNRNGNIANFNCGVTSEDINRGNRGGIFDPNITLEAQEVPTALTFDTGKTANPYPSISGTHNGSITPYETIYNVSTLYTYPCPGTGGHTEYVAFYYDPNRTEKITEGHWNGYDSDWYNISFSSFTMLANHTYYYTLKTGSYPQIHHAPVVEAEEERGIINCTSFVDANGRSYTNWIPAIRLIGESANSAEVQDENPKLAFSSHYDPTNVSVTPNVPSYQLPLTSGDISNFEKINTVFNLSESAKELLRSNGFVIINYGHEDDITAPYEYLKWHEVPIFVTADTLLHLYHIQFNEILKGVEEREFFDELVTMSKAMLVRAEHDYNNFSDSEPELKEAARRNVAYFSVALKLLQTPTEGYNGNGNGSENIREINFSIPNYVKDEVEAEIANIEKHEGFQPSPIFNSNANCSCSDSCCYCEDYSQYVPRGHYTQSEKLKRYFKAMMWYGRMAFLLKGCNGDDALVSEHDAKISTIQAALISSELPEVKAGDKPVQEIWDRIYAVTAFFVGKADDLTPYEYANALNSTFGVDFNLSELSDEANLLALKAELAKMRSPEIYGGSGVCVVYPPITREKLYECLDKTKGMRFMGQRFVPDSYMFQQLVSPAVGMYVGNDTPFTMCITQLGPERCFPRGLDVMAVLGSEMAEDILREEGDTEYGSKSDNKPVDVCSNSNNMSYDIQLNTLKSDFAGVNISEWNQNLYWSWLYTLKPLLTEFGDGYPTFMQTEAWQKKELQTALASWTELRHDTILYVKQSYTPPRSVAMPPKPVGYVEPVPEFYARLLSLTQMTEEGLADLDVLTETEQERLQSLERILERLVNISKAELENKELNESDYEFIRNFGESMDSIVAGVDARGMNTTIVADVHTDCNTKKVLEEGVGYVNMILVAYNVPDGRIIVGAGPVFSYYEFKHPMDDRLTDEKWKEMLENEKESPEVQEWVKEIMG